ncbi:MAG TPA: PDZ domain-containing protein [Longimicrobiales bacterium]
MKAPYLLLPFLAVAPAAARAQAPVRYDVSFPNVVHHEARIEATFAELPDGPLDVRMSRSSPGRYAVHEFAKNVYAVEAYDGAGRRLDITRPDPYGWTIAGHDGTVRFVYTLFADRADGTYSGIDASHAHLNMPATFVWARGLERRPITVTFHPPRGSDWKVATQLAPTDDPFTFTAPNLYYFFDSPAELSDFDLRTWTVPAGDRTYTIRLALHHAGTDAALDRYTEMAKKVVAEELAIFGAPADYDFGTYTFIADYLPWVAGDGMEHRNSTILTSTRALEGDGMLRNLGTLAHEFFHSWNVERIRPKTLEPFDFERANMSRELWLAEGFTSYYEDLALRRAGLISDDDYAAALSGVVNAVVNMPGRRFFSPVEMSMRAPFVDAATAIDPTNHANIFISYYTWGAAIGLGLDLTLRTRFGSTLDDFMREMWRAHGKPEKPYALDDVRAALARTSKDTAFAREFFDRYIGGRDVVDYEALLARAGFLVRRAAPGRPSLGRLSVALRDGHLVVTAPTLIGSPVYDAGIDRGDRILSLDGHALTSEADLAAVLAAHAPGDHIPVTYEQRGRTRSATITLVEDPTLEVVTFEKAGRPLTEEIRALRAAWLGSKAGRRTTS